MWPNFEIGGLLLRSAVATKCRAAQRTFDATGEGVVWAVLDSGVDAGHRHFAAHRTLELPDGLEPRSFVPEVDDPLVDANGHGTHVAATIAGGLAPGDAATGVGWYLDPQGVEQRQAVAVDGITGMAPAAKILSCAVLRADRTGDVTALLEALAYIQQLNDGGRRLRVHGVNISVGHMFDPRWYAAGRTPVCREVDRLVASGVVVVVAAGNTGYGYAKDPEGRPMRLGFQMTINDPGNAERAITVGATSSNPHTTGVSYFSSKGPTGDGRMKPDLVAPGERIISAAAGELLRQAQLADPGAEYIESSGTSMAAPHVSGAAAGLMSVHPELIGAPDRVKSVLMQSATDLGRSRSFQGAGMLDAMRAAQSI
jgi:subtilisin family serine protease